MRQAAGPAGLTGETEPGPARPPLPASRVDGDDKIALDMHPCWRWKRKVFVSSMTAAGLLCFMLYILSFSCCVLVTTSGDQSRGSRVLIINPESSSTQEEQRYQRETMHLENTDHIRHNNQKLMRKTLHQVEASDSKGSSTHNADKNTASSHYRNEQMVPTEEDELNGYTVEDDKDDTRQDDNEEYKSYGSYSDLAHSNHMNRPDRGTRTSPPEHRSVILRTHKNATRKLPQAIIIGVKKGGTRALLEFLRIHPDIRAPGPEPHFFDRHYNRGTDWYRRQMPSTIEGQITMEKTPSYFVTKGVPGRIYNMSKKIKLIVVVRDPVTRAISDYTQAVSKRSDIKPFEQMAFLDNATGLVDTSWGAIRIGVYAKHLERWLKYFPLNQIHFVSGEKLITEPASVMAEVQDFLGLKHVITDKHFYFNSTKGFPCLKKAEGSGNPHCLGKTKGRHHPKVDPKVIKRLRDFFRPFNAKFYQMSGQDFGWP